MRPKLTHSFNSSRSDQPGNAHAKNTNHLDAVVEVTGNNVKMT